MHFSPCSDCGEPAAEQIVPAPTEDDPHATRVEQMCLNQDCPRNKPPAP